MDPVRYPLARRFPRLKPTALGLFLAASFLSAPLLPAEDALGPERWEKQMAAFEAEQAATPAAPGSLLFVGSSSIRLWELPASWPGEKVVNRGFGGSMLPDTVFYFDRIVAPLRPRAIVVYAGDNDLAKGRTPRQVVADFEALVAKRDRALPGVPVVYIAIKPSVKRWELWPAMKEANEGIRALCSADRKLHFADIAAPMLEGAAGAPRAEWFKEDGLHLSPMGYARWTEIVRQCLVEAGAVK